MNVERSSMQYVESWAQLRAALWPDDTVESHRNDVIRTFLAGDNRAAAFVCKANTGEVVGFAEATLRSDYVNGCETSPVLFLEGIYVRPDYRRKGVAVLLCDAVADWGRSIGCSEFASDALLENAESHKFHAAVGFTETKRVVFFRKTL